MAERARAFFGNRNKLRNYQLEQCNNVKPNNFFQRQIGQVDVIENNHLSKITLSN